MLSDSLRYRALRMTFTQPAAYRFLIDVSDDRSEWRPLADFSINDKPLATIDALAPANATGRFIRLRFNSSPPNVSIQLSEVECVGILRNQ